MKQMRWLVAILIIWLFVFYNLERLSGPINLTRAAYLLVPILAVITIAMPSLARIPTWFHVGFPIPIFLVMKRVLVGRLWGSNYPITVTEMCAIILTVFLARQVGLVVNDFERVLTRISISGVDPLDGQSGDGHDQMGREVRRARKFRRPLSMLAVSVGNDSYSVALDHMTLSVQQSMMKHYTLCGVAKALTEGLEDHNLIAMNKDYFLVLLPETTPETAHDVMDQVTKSVQAEVGVAPMIGLSSFPGDAMTFEGLVSKATGTMNSTRQAHVHSESQQGAA